MKRPVTMASSQAGCRLRDLICAALGLLVLWPVLGVLAAVIRLREGSPVLFGQMRVGRHGKPFRIWKFRTMRCGIAGGVVTAAGDRRITATGTWLRRFKLDELPQLWNVLKGDMSLVGPRPEVPEYVDRQAPLWQAVLQVSPGITDLATLLYRDEETLLSGSTDVDTYYREIVLPAKLRWNLVYLRTRSFWKDARLIWLTIAYSLAPQRLDPGRIHQFASETGYVESFCSLSSAVDR
jgi:lipopolysaccharide/colanic/teichoic acid biosynthesis glycosyltransferase